MCIRDRLSSQDNEEGQRARKIVNVMGIGTNSKGEMLDTDAASAQVNADLSLIHISRDQCR